METMEINSIDNFASALCEVRKAHRLIYSYQSRILSLIRFIRTKLGFEECLIGYKHFSYPLERTKESMFKLKVYEDMWAWDFLYTYIFAYYCNKRQLDATSTISLYIIQYSDTGYFENFNEDKKGIPNPTEFKTAKESGTKLMFILEKCHKDSSEYLNDDTTGQLIMNPQYASKHFTKAIIEPYGKDKNKLFLYSIPLERFLNEESTLLVLNEFLEFLKDNDVELRLY